MGSRDLSVVHGGEKQMIGALILGVVAGIFFGAGVGVATFVVAWILL